MSKKISQMWVYIKQTSFDNMLVWTDVIIKIKTIFFGWRLTFHSRNTGKSSMRRFQNKLFRVTRLGDCLLWHFFKVIFLYHILGYFFNKNSCNPSYLDFFFFFYGPPQTRSYLDTILVGLHFGRLYQKASGHPETIAVARSLKYARKIRYDIWKN
jgi:hypothetical protein